MIGYYGGHRYGFSDGINETDNNFSKIQHEWLHKDVEATGDYFGVYNGSVVRFKGEVVAVTVRPWGTFVTVYNVSTNALYSEERIEYFKLING
jgi:hypothetical protein